MNKPIDLCELERVFRKDRSDELRFLAEQNLLVDRPDGNGPFYAPYLPWVGPDYRPGGILLMATAQNLGQFSHDSSPERQQLWMKATGWPNHTLRRLYPDSFDAWRTVPIQPWMDGVLAALAGLWMLARDGNAPERLEDVARQVAVTNFFKHSLRKRNKSGRQVDLNPKNIDHSLQERFIRVTRKRYVDAEVSALRPAAVIGFKTVEAMGGFSDFPVEVRVVNDPSWIKQGMRGVASEGGSWQARVEKSQAAISSVATSRIDSWIPQLASSYSGGKRDATSIYLKCCLLDFCER